MPQKILRVDEKIVAKQIQKLKRLKAQRDNIAVKTSLEKLKVGAEGSDNLIPLIINCVEKYATVGEISHTLRTVFGEYSE